MHILTADSPLQFIDRTEWVPRLLGDRDCEVEHRPVWFAPMPRRTFDDLLSDFSRARLIVGHVESLKATATAEKVIGQLIESLGPRAYWAIGQMQDGRGFAVHCVFARPEDAQKVAAAVQAKGIGRYPGFASRREFTLDTVLRKNISAALTEHRNRQQGASEMLLPPLYSAWHRLFG